MCLILFSYKMHPKYRLIIAANRDEYYARPTAPAAFWQDVPYLLAGRDLKEGGTWLGVTKKGRIAALTNYRNPPNQKEGAPSRGLLISNYLCGYEDALSYLRNLVVRADQYNGFSMILGDFNHLYYFSNYSCVTELMPGLYGLSNRLLNTPWPKVEKGKKALADLLAKTDDPSYDDIFEILSDRSQADDISLPETGVDLAWERILSSIFIASPDYGTRSSTVIMIDRKNWVTFIERVFDVEGSGHWMTAKLQFKSDPV